MKHFIDGDQLCITKDDFVNLQESPAVFYPLDGDIAKAVLEAGSVIGLPIGDLARICNGLVLNSRNRHQERDERDT